MQRAFWAVFVLAVIAVISLSFGTSCKHIGPIERCSGKSVNRRLVPNTSTTEDACTECIEATCCDLIGDCQGTACADEVAETHACVEDAKRAAAIEEPGCRSQHLRGDQSKKVYQCMRDNCDDECQLPTCKLDPLVPALGDIQCDRCFAQTCCPLMNECAKDRTCLLALSCIIDECRDDFARELSFERHAAAALRSALACDGGAVPPTDADRDGGIGCFANCISKVINPEDPQSLKALCLSTQINECGAFVNCGRFCGSETSDAGGDAASPPDAGADALVDAADDGPSDAGAD